MPDMRVWFDRNPRDQHAVVILLPPAADAGGSVRYALAND
jgi:hypothetical protein